MAAGRSSGARTGPKSFSLTLGAEKPQFLVLSQDHPQKPLRFTPGGLSFFRGPTIAKLLPETADGLLDELDRRFPEPRPNPNDTDADIRWRLAQRSVVLQMRDAYRVARKGA